MFRDMKEGLQRRVDNSKVSPEARLQMLHLRSPAKPSIRPAFLSGAGHSAL